MSREDELLNKRMDQIKEYQSMHIEKAKQESVMRLQKQNIHATEEEIRVERRRMADEAA